MVYLFLCLLLKREYIVLIIILPYIFYLAPMLYNLIDSLVVKYLHIKNFCICFYTVFGMFQIASNLEPSNGIKIAVLLGYLVPFIAGSFLVFAKKGLKDGDNSDGLISVTDLKKSFGKKSILADINSNIGQGELYGLIGNNVAGKTQTPPRMCRHNPPA